MGNNKMPLLDLMALTVSGGEFCFTMQKGTYITLDMPLGMLPLPTWLYITTERVVS